MEQEHCLESEVACYQREKRALEGAARGKFVLIHGERVVGLFDTRRQAIAAGYDQLGVVPFLVRCVGDEPRELDLMHLLR
ncbi:MAG: hypothetical protein L3K13_04315 [Thermoplasmata archaeon]|nr:hypothetical protein [Thermoplasmata archaeon]